MTKFLQLSFLFCISIFTLASCDKEELTSSTDESLQFFISADEDQTADALALASTTEVQALSTSFSGEVSHRFHGDCFTLVFPVDIAFPDSTTVTVADAAAMRQAVVDWVDAGGQIERGNRPSLVYPIEVQLADGTIETVAERSDLRSILVDCSPNVERCVTLLFPVSFDQDGTSVSYADAAEVRAGLAAYYTANPDGPKATLIFPVNIENADGDTVEVTSLLQIRRLKLACRSDRRNSFRDCFDFVFPVTLVNSDGETLEATSNSELRRALSRCNRSGEYAFQYPFDVTLADGTTQTITEASELQALRQSCR